MASPSVEQHVLRKLPVGFSIPFALRGRTSQRCSERQLSVSRKGGHREMAFASGHVPGTYQCIEHTCTTPFSYSRIDSEIPPHHHHGKTCLVANVCLLFRLAPSGAEHTTRTKDSHCSAGTTAKISDGCTDANGGDL